MNVKRWQWPLLLIILLVAAALRLTGLDWDSYQHYHPDERFVTWVATTIEAPAGLDTAFDPHRSSFNPYYWPPDAHSQGIVVPQDEDRHFAYGHLPLYLGVAATRSVEAVAPLLHDRLPGDWLLARDILNGAGWVEFRHLTAVARALTAFVDVATVALVFLLGRRLFRPAVGLLAAAFLSVNVMHVQLAHFFAVDPYLTFFIVAALFLMVVALDAAGERTFPFLLLAAACIGLAVGSKFTAVLLFLPLAVVFTFRWDWTDDAYWRRLLAAGSVALVAFFLTNPFALLDWTCTVVTPAQRLGPLTIPAIDWRSCFLENVVRQSGMVRGGAAFPFTIQYTGAVHYLYHVIMQLRWGMGPLMGIAAFSGFAWASWRGLRAAWHRWRRLKHPAATSLSIPPAEAAVLSWTLPYFLVTGSFTVKFMRYFQPLTPFLMIYAAALLLGWRRHKHRSWWPRAAVVIVLLGTALYALAFVNLYGQPHPWEAASRWIHRNVPAGALILSEKWDDPLPSSLTVDGEYRSRDVYESGELVWLSGVGPQDDEEKLQQNLDLLAAGDYVVIASNRSYAVVPRLPDVYPLSSRYHPLLFDGALGYEPVYVTGRSPTLAGLSLWPDRFGRPRLQPPPLVVDFLRAVPRLSFGPADESFTVYDQPLVIVFQNTGRLSPAEMEQRFRSYDSRPQER
ncbi:MAG: glycosyltransferase family 39 protein [Candidatus Promineifilaceae bacterium]|nr:glycosyltransferase family 39 protein [Candidatus Promineifilaceae bacterium]